MDKCYLGKKGRQDPWSWNHSIKIGRKPAIDGNRQWKPAVVYRRDADDFVIVVKGSKQQAEDIRDQCCDFLEGKLKLTLNMDQTHTTHVNGGFNFLGHRIIRKRGPKDNMRIVTGIPLDKAKAFSHPLSDLLQQQHD